MKTMGKNQRKTIQASFYIIPIRVHILQIKKKSIHKSEIFLHASLSFFRFPDRFGAFCR